MSYRIDRLFMLLNDASRALRRRFVERTADYGLSATQWRLLGLVQFEGPMTQAALAERLDVEPMSISRLIDRMEAAGWVQRIPHPQDRRARIVQPTEKARAAAPDVRAIADAVSEEALSGLGDAERRALQAALLTLIETLNAPASEPESER